MKKKALTSGHYLIVQADFYAELAAAQKQGAVAELETAGQAMMLFLCLVRLKYLLLSQWLQPTHALMTALLLWDVSSGVRQPITKRFAQNHLGGLWTWRFTEIWQLAMGF
ncbi:MAG: hypothetical protein CM15mP100_5680 [Alphaproteobacteria bacterium]|nr:MAG: hypothetical protein CM15mP100_5680 [Alphaproteobacteria bacterium]